MAPEIRSRLVPLHRSACVRHGPAGAGSLWLAQTAFAEWAKQDSVDVYWSPRHHLPLASDLPPSLVTIHDLVWRRFPETMTVSGRLLEKVVSPRSIRQSRAIMVPSEFTGKELAEYYPDASGKIHVVPLAPGLARPSLADRPENQGRRERYVLAVGTLEPRKNFGRLIDAFASLIDRTEQPHVLKIVGNRGWKNRRVIERLSDPALRGRVHYLGNIPDRELSLAYAGAEFLVAPSLYEGFGLQVLEAMSFGLPIIATQESALSELLGGAGVLVDPYSIQDMASAMLRLMEDPQLRRQLGSAAALRAQRYSWARTAELTLDVLESVV